MKTTQRARGAQAPVAKVRRPRPRPKKEVPPEGERQEDEGFLFKDAYWDDQFCSYYSPTLRTCCNR